MLTASCLFPRVCVCVCVCVLGENLGREIQQDIILERNRQYMEELLKTQTGYSSILKKSNK